MTDRRALVLAGALAALAPQWVLGQARQPKIGILAPRPLEKSLYAPGLVQRLAELGYRNGAGARIYYRSSDGAADRYPKLVEELVKQGCELFFAVGPEQPVRALRYARVHAPVVFLAVDYDPLERGLVSTLRNPDGNRTGVYIPQNVLAVKRLHFMREIVPQGRNFLLLADPFCRGQIDAVRRAADSVRVNLTVVEFTKRPYDYARTIDAGLKAEVQGVMTLSSPVFLADAAQLGAQVLKRRLPGAGSAYGLVEAGFLLSLGANVTKVSRRVAEIGARVLQGTRTGDIPVEQADEFDLSLNAKAAHALGIKLPDSLLARATSVLS